MIEWPDLKFPPINLWSLPKMEPKDIVETTNYKFFQNKDCEFFPCHGMEDDDLNCLFCYCPLAFLQCPGEYTVIESPKDVKRKDCSECTVTHGSGGWDLVQKCLVKPKPWNEK